MAKRAVKIVLHSDDEYQQIIDEFKKESDRATVILSAAKLDAQLYLLLSKKLKPSYSSQDELLDGDNPLGTFSSKINMAYRVGLINTHFAKSLHLIRKIRNAFAHEFKSMSLTNGGHADRIRELMVHFKDYVDYQEYKELHFGEEQGLNVDFKIIVAIAILRLDTALHYAEPIDSDGTDLIPPIWKKVLIARDQKSKGPKRSNNKNIQKKTAANKVLPKAGLK